MENPQAFYLSTFGEKWCCVQITDLFGKCFRTPNIYYNGLTWNEYIFQRLLLSLTVTRFYIIYLMLVFSVACCAARL